MIKRFRHKGLHRLFETGERKGLSQTLLPKIERILARLDVATNPEAMRLPGLKLHALEGNLKGFWSVWVSGNFRIIFRFEENNVVDVDLVDYH
jgi:toxin HigB-1